MLAIILLLARCLLLFLGAGRWCRGCWHGALTRLDHSLMLSVGQGHGHKLGRIMLALLIVIITWSTNLRLQHNHALACHSTSFNGRRGVIVRLAYLGTIIKTAGHSHLVMLIARLNSMLFCGRHLLLQCLPHVLLRWATATCSFAWFATRCATCPRRQTLARIAMILRLLSLSKSRSRSYWWVMLLLLIMFCSTVVLGDLEQWGLELMTWSTASRLRCSFFGVL